MTDWDSKPINFMLLETLPSSVPTVGWVRAASSDPRLNWSFEGADPIEVPCSSSGSSAPVHLALYSVPVVFGQTKCNLICFGDPPVLLPSFALIGGPWSLPSHSSCSV